MTPSDPWPLGGPEPGGTCLHTQEGWRTSRVGQGEAGRLGGVLCLSAELPMFVHDVPLIGKKMNI